MKKLFLLSACFYTSTTLPVGFAAGTLVKVQNGHIPIEQIQEGDKVITFKSTNVLGHSINSYPSLDFDSFFVRLWAFGCIPDIFFLVKITIDDESLFVAPDQQFILPMQELIYAGDLKAGDVTVGMNRRLLKIDNVERIGIRDIEAENAIYTLFVEDAGIFFVSKHNFAVFNSPHSTYRSIKKGLSNAAETLLYESPKIILRLFLGF